MTISQYHKLFVLSAIMCAVPVSDAYCGPLFTRAWGVVSRFFTRPPQHSFGTLPRKSDPIDLSDSYHVVNNSTNSTESSYSPSSEWLSTNTLLAGAAVVGAAVATGYSLYTWYTGYKQREEERKAQEELRRAELLKEVEDSFEESQQRQDREKERALQTKQALEAKKIDGMFDSLDDAAQAVAAEEKLEKIMRGKQRDEALVEEERALKERKARERSALRARLEARKKKQKAQAPKQKKKREKLREDKLACERARKDDQLIEDVFHVVERITLSEKVKNCSLCNQLTVQYLNVLHKDKGKEDKKQVIAFLTSDTSKDKELWNNRNILDVISKEDPHFVMQRLEYIAKGEQYVKEITSGKNQLVPQSNQREYLDSIISITWYFYAKALEKGDGFSKSGSFNIESHALLAFFKNYHDIVREEWFPQFGETVRAWLANRVRIGNNKLGDHPFAYKRCSSHLKGFDAGHYGIDIRFALEGDQEDAIASLKELLPDDKAHLLLIPYDKQKGRFLLKPEACATSVFDLPDAAKHGAEFMHGSKDNDYDHTRREKMKKDVKYQEFLAEYRLVAPKDQSEYVQDIKQYGVQKLLERLDHWINNVKSVDQSREKRKKLRREIVDAYTDHHDIRFAHEVVFKETDFR